MALFLILPAVVAVAGKPVPVRLARVGHAPIQNAVRLTGTIIAIRHSALSSRVDAMVEEVLVEAGDRVNGNDILVKLDSAMAEFDVQQSAAALEEAGARLKDSVRRRDELGKLLKNQHMARSSYDSTVAEVRMNTAIVKRLQAEYESSREEVRRHLIKAPYSGVISDKNVDAGEWIKVGDSILDLVDIDRLRVVVQVPQRFYSSLAKGSVVVITPDAMPDRKIRSTVTHRIPVASRSAHTFPVHVDLENQGQVLTPGMSVGVELSLDEQGVNESVLLVPRDAVNKKPGQPDRVWTVREEQGQLRSYPVTVQTGRVSKGEVEIINSGLQQGDTVIVRGNETLKPGQDVRVID